MQEMKVSSCDPVWLLWRQGPSIACQVMARYVHVRSKVQRHGQTGTGGCGCSRTCILSKSLVHVRACCYRSLPTPFCLFRPDRSLSASSAGRGFKFIDSHFPASTSTPDPQCVVVIGHARRRKKREMSSTAEGRMCRVWCSHNGAGGVEESGKVRSAWSGAASVVE